MSSILLNDDCLEALKYVETDSVDLVAADLPYGVTHNKWDSVIPFQPLWEQLLRVGKPHAAFVFTATQPFASRLIASHEALFRYELIWAKTAGTGYANANQRPMAAHEGIYVFSRATANPMSKLRMVYNPQKTPGKPYKQASGKQSKNWGTGLDKSQVTDNATGDRHPLSVWTIPSERGKLHPTQKPLELMERIVLSYTNPGDTVLDPTMGSGTTGLAAKNFDRHFIGIEKDSNYFDIASKRIGG